MTVSELIEYLSQLPPDAPVVVHYWNESTLQSECRYAVAPRVAPTDLGEYAVIPTRDKIGSAVGEIRGEWL
jgi:hypothetical protein